MQKPFLEARKGALRKPLLELRKAIIGMRKGLLEKGKLLRNAEGWFENVEGNNGDCPKNGVNYLVVFCQCFLQRIALKRS